MAKEEDATAQPTVVKPGIGYIDTGLTRAILPTLPVWHCMSFTPNMLTTLGLGSSAACVWFLAKRKFGAAVGFLIARMYFDYADGLLARKYKQTSAIGDWYDHMVDCSFAVGVALVLVFSKYKTGTGNWWVDHTKHISLGLLALFGAAFVVQMGCIEHEYNNEDNLVKEETSISRLRHLCPPTLIPIIKSLDNGTLYIVMGIIFYLFCTVAKP